MQDVNSSNIAFAQGLTDIESIASDNVSVKRVSRLTIMSYWIWALLVQISFGSTKEVKNAKGEAAIPEHRLAVYALWHFTVSIARALSKGLL